MIGNKHIHTFMYVCIGVQHAYICTCVTDAYFNHLEKGIKKMIPQRTSQAGCRDSQGVVLLELMNS